MPGPKYSHAQLKQLWVLEGGSEATADTAAAIAQAESGGCQYALAGPVDIRPVKTCTWTVTNGENSCGLWQINLRAHPSYSAPTIFNELTNAGAAVAISNGGSDFGPWTTYVSGAYKTYLRSGGTPTAQPGTVFVPTGPIQPVASSGGWHHLTLGLARALPEALHHSQQLRASALRALKPPHRIGRDG
jgi:hypothetical protein